MKKNPGIDVAAPSAMAVLSISANNEHHSSLENLLGHPYRTLFKAETISTARTVLQSRNISVVVWDCDSMPGTWIDILDHLQNMANPPSVIVASRLADDRLWAEALNCGAWDVLAKPFERTEVLRSVRFAWEHWRRQAMVAPPAKVLSAAS